MQDYLQTAITLSPKRDRTWPSFRGRCCVDRGMTSSLLRHDTPLTAEIETMGVLNTQPQRHRVLITPTYTHISSIQPLDSNHSTSRKPIVPTHHTLHQQPNFTQPSKCPPQENSEPAWPRTRRPPLTLTLGTTSLVPLTPRVPLAKLSLV
jgi:hypothetical protein